MGEIAEMMVEGILCETCGVLLDGTVMLARLADALACSTDYLLGRTDEPR